MRRWSTPLLVGSTMLVLYLSLAIMRVRCSGGRRTTWVFEPDLTLAIYAICDAESLVEVLLPF